MIFIQAPAFGNSLPPELPSTNKGKPIPKLKAYKAEAPKTTSPVCDIYNNAPVNGAVVQGEATNPEITPIINTPAYEPPFCWLLIALSLFCQLAGKAKLNSPNIDRAKKINKTLKLISTIGC